MQVFLAISVIWSFKTSALTSTKLKAMEKLFLPPIDKLVLGLRALIIFVVRICCCVAFFAPFLGLGGIMDHYTAERISLDGRLFSRLNATDTSFHFWNNRTDTQDSVALSDIFRSDYTDLDNPLHPAYTVYTGVSLRTAYLSFCALIPLYAGVILAAKFWCSPSFRKAGWPDKLGHLLESLNIPDRYTIVVIQFVISLL